MALRSSPCSCSAVEIVSIDFNSCNARHTHLRYRPHRQESGLRFPTREFVESHPPCPEVRSENPFRCLRLSPRLDRSHRPPDLNQTERTFGVNFQVQRCAETEWPCGDLGGDPKRYRVLGRLTRFLRLFEVPHAWVGQIRRKTRALNPIDTLMPRGRQATAAEALACCPTGSGYEWAFPASTLGGSGGNSDVLRSHIWLEPP